MDEWFKMVNLNVSLEILLLALPDEMSVCRWNHPNQAFAVSLLLKRNA